jgi:hypothetical protein
MTVTEKMAREINGLLKALGEAELTIPKQGELVPELELLRRVKEQYAGRLLQKMPQYRSLPTEAIPDMFLQALRKRENELESETES